MKFGETPIAGVFIVDIEAHVDERGAFARTFCGDQFVAHGLPAKFVQCNLSTNVHKGTLRGMHWQSEPKPEGKLVRCQRGAIYDVALDLRPRSPTYLLWFGVELNEDNARALYVPEGCAHGFQTLRDRSDVFYQMTEAYDGALARGARWNDPAFGIAWPLADPILSPRDSSYPDFDSARAP